MAKSGKFALDAAGSAGKATLKSAAEEMAKAESGNSDIVDIARNGQGASADVGNVKGIAKGIKTIVDTAKKSDAKLELKAAAEGGSNKEAGKLFAVGADAGGAANDVKTAAEKAATAVSSVSGEQILAAIVDTAKKSDAKLELKAAAEGGSSNKEAGKLFAVNAVADGAANDVKTAAEKAATAVSSVSGEQILAAIVDAAEKGNAGKAAGAATNAIEAAIGGAGAADFNDNNGIGKKNDQIAAAIVLRGYCGYCGGRSRSKC
ncbi:hypothetical protein DB723_05155 (plasmid) [Borrelia maritima]|uniref:Variable large protein n=1 Tax=Borrelia maritima TaxID=2761123 RepID=A0A5J6WG07_9SPIR|nr:hypothetical protein DB723_05155 [Borrelia maritima]